MNCCLRIIGDCHLPSSFPLQPSSDAGFSSSSDDDDYDKEESDAPSSSSLPPPPTSCASSQEGEAMMEVRWFWSPQELLVKKEDRTQCLLRELFESDRVDEIPVVRREGGREREGGGCKREERAHPEPELKCV